MAEQTRRGSSLARSMGRIALMAVLAAACALPGQRASALRLPEGERPPRVLVNALWNRDYLCLAARVPDTILTGTSAGPMSAPQQDDAVEFSLEVPGPASPSAHRLIISAAGGMTVLSRDARGHWRNDSSWITGQRTVKYAIATTGTLNDPSDRDTSFAVECAIPWEFLGGEAPIGEEIGFNAVCWMQGENEGIASWSPSVREPEHAGDAARWGRMLISLGPELRAASGMYVVCPFVGRTPFIDGMLAAADWLVASSLSFDKPEPMLEPAPEPSERTGVVGTVLAIYRYDWQGDAQREDGAPLWRPDGLPGTSDQPRRGSGPWQSYDRVDWHAAQLGELQRAGIDIALARYSGTEAARRTWARTGLERLAQALKERRADGRGYPLVGMMLDTEALRGADLTSEEGKRSLYGMIREFYLRIPREFWAEVGAWPEEGLPGGVPVLLGSPAVLAAWDGGFLEFCRERFADDWPGERIVWLGSSEWRERAVDGFYCCISLPAQTGFTQSTPDAAPAVAISPGRFAADGEADGILARREGRSYRNDWQRALAARPELIIVDSWNDFAEGTEIAPSRQYGFAYVDATRYFQARMGSEQEHYLWAKQRRLPAVLKPGADYHVEILVENAGMHDLHTSKRVTADYQIRRRSDGEVVQKKISAQGLSIAAGQTLRLPVLISTRDSAGDPLPPGEYVFSLSVMRSKVAYLRSRWFARTVAELTVPITVGATPPYRASVISTSLPSAMQTGTVTNTVVRLRNDGAEAWRKGGVFLSYSWVRHDDNLGRSSVEARQLVARDGGRAELPREVAPGEVVSVMIPVRAVAADGRPLRPARPDSLWHYRIQWDLVTSDGTWFGEAGRGVSEEAIHVAARDLGGAILSVEAPAEMSAGERITAVVSVANVGGRPWAGEHAHLALQWFRWDGRAVASPAPGTGLPADIDVGETVEVKADVEAPSAPGNYWLAWRIGCGGDRAEEPVVGIHRDLSVSPVFVRASRIAPVDLSAFSNVAAVTTDEYRARGDFDGQGRSFPSEWIPPDLSGPREHLYQSGYYSPGGPDVPVAFAFPALSSGVGGAVACAGQSIPLGQHGAARVHLLAASTAGTGEAAFGLKSPAGDVDEVRAVVPSWTDPYQGVPVGVYAPYLRTLSGDDPAIAGYLYHLTLVSPSREAVSLELPRAAWIKILAVTAESM